MDENQQAMLPDPETPPRPPDEPDDAAAGWQLSRWRVVEPIAGRRIELQLSLFLEDFTVAAMVARANEREAELARAIDAAIAGLPERAAYLAAADRLRGIEAARQKVQDQLQQFDAVLNGSPSAEQVEEVAAQDAGLRSQLAIMDRALEAARRSQTDAVRALAASARRAAHAAQAALAGQLNDDKGRACGLVRTAAAELNALVAAAILSGRLHWRRSEMVSEGVVSALTGGEIPPPVLMPDPLPLPEPQPSLPPGMVAPRAASADAYPGWTWLGPGTPTPEPSNEASRS
jgi:hypothetical protein